LTARVCFRRGDGPLALREREWLVTNGLGGYASGTAGGQLTRRFHGHLVAALPPPRGRVLAVSALDATGCGQDELEELRLELGLPVFRYRAVEKRVVLAHGRNLALVSYRAREPLTLAVRPAFQIRPHEGRVDGPARDYPVSIDGGVCEVDRGTALPIRLVASGGAWRAVPPRVRTVRYQVEEERGYDCEGPLVEPCELTVRLSAGEEMTLALSTEAPDRSTSGRCAAGRRSAGARSLRVARAASPSSRWPPISSSWRSCLGRPASTLSSPGTPGSPTGAATR
jgi:hypothetical protein